MTWHLCENLLATVHIWKWSFKTGNFVLLFTKQGGLWLGMTGGLSTQVKMNVKPIGAFKSGLIRQVVFELQGVLKSRDHCTYPKLIQLETVPLPKYSASPKIVQLLH